MEYLKHDNFFNFKIRPAIPQWGFSIREEDTDQKSQYTAHALRSKKKNSHTNSMKTFHSKN